MRNQDEDKLIVVLLILAGLLLAIYIIVQNPELITQHLGK